tara:strand:+ start:1466 stop:2236 length:771 start_codon:yes stop_codon:yes gene_type:complete
MSLVVQNNLRSSQQTMQTAMQRLSSGLRINSAKDDPAGQAIANRMTAQINGMHQAIRNTNDGISMVQTAEGSLNQINDNLQRIRQLSVQAANGTNSSNDLVSIQAEIGQRLEEIDRIAGQSQFNGIGLIDETQSLNIQVGANAGDTIAVRFEAMNLQGLGLEGLSVLDDGSGTENPIDRVDEAIKKLDRQRSYMGLCRIALKASLKAWITALSTPLPPDHVFRMPITHGKSPAFCGLRSCSKRASRCWRRSTGSRR